MATVMRAAFCDDSDSALQEMLELLDRYCADRQLEIEPVAFRSPLELLGEIERGIQFDVVFLDILMPGQNGIETAEEIRNYDNNTKIIFLTSSADYAVQSYKVHAYFYQLKPVRAEEFFSVLDSVLSLCEQERGSALILRCKTGITRLEPGQLEFCEVIHRTLFVHLAGGKVLEMAGSLDGLCRQLEPYGCFLRPHRSYLINLDYVQSISFRAVVMASLVEIPIPRGKYGEIKQAFLARAFQSRQVVV